MRRSAGSLVTKEQVSCVSSSTTCMLARSSEDFQTASDLCSPSGLEQWPRPFPSCCRSLLGTGQMLAAAAVATAAIGSDHLDRTFAVRSGAHKGVRKEVPS